MRPVHDLLKHERHTRLFYLAHAQSSLGTGAAYVALVVLAYDRVPSAWAISLVLFADFLPSMLFGPLFGAIADRFSRKACAITADILRAFAFIALGLTGNFWLILILALLAGVGTGLSRPAVLAALPGLVPPKRLPAATSLYGTIADAGFTLGPAVAALGLILASPEMVMVVNGVTFGISAVLLTRVSFGDAPAERRESRRSLVGESREGIRTATRLPGVRPVILASSAVLMFAGLFNVGELLLARDELGVGNGAFAVLIAVFGAGVAAGSMAGAAGGTLAHMKSRYLWGLALTGAGFLGTALAGTFAVALATFALAGVGNGLVVVHERLLLQRVVPDAVMGRVFGLLDSAASWGWAIAFALAGVLFGLVGTREMLAVAGIGAVAVAVAAAWSLRTTWREEGADGQHVLPELVDRLDTAEPPAVARA